MQFIRALCTRTFSKSFPCTNNSLANLLPQFRSLQHLLSSPSFPHPARVIWISSLEASPTLYNGIEDWQNTTTEYSYQSTKYQMDILATQIENLSIAKAKQPSSEAQAIRHFVTDPGICSTNVNRDITGPFMDTMKLVFFYIVRIYLPTVQKLPILLSCF